eukprot:2298392-Rhodomonas_salina.3
MQRSGSIRNPGLEIKIYREDGREVVDPYSEGGTHHHSRGRLDPCVAWNVLLHRSASTSIVVIRAISQQACTEKVQLRRKLQTWDR